jgi:putative DNA primase/helicase
MSVSKNNYRELTAEEVSYIISFIPPDCDYVFEWIPILMSIHQWSGGSNVGYSICKNWSAGGANYKEVDWPSKWRSFKRNGGIGIGTLVDLAKKYGYNPRRNYNTSTHVPSNEKSPAEIVEVSEKILTRGGVTQEESDQQFDDFLHKYTQISRPAPDNHPYLARKRVKPHDLRVIDIIATPKVMSGNTILVVPMSSIITFNDDYLMVTQSLQFIYPNDDNDKRNYPDRDMSGCFYVFNGTTAEIYLVEGWGTGASLFEHTGATVIVCFPCNNMSNVAKNIGKLYPTESYPNTKFVIAADNDLPGLSCAQEAAQILQAEIICPPEKGDDFNDYINKIKEQQL